MTNKLEALRNAVLEIGRVSKEYKVKTAVQEALQMLDIDQPKYQGDIEEDCITGELVVLPKNQADLYHELMRLHDRLGGPILKEAADLIRSQRKEILRLENEAAHTIE